MRGAGQGLVSLRVEGWWDGLVGLVSLRGEGGGGIGEPEG